MSNLKIMMKYFRLPIGRNYPVRVFVLLFALVSLGRAYAAPTIVSTDPPRGASGVALSAAVTINFSEAMNPTVTVANFIATSPYQSWATSLSWSAGNTVLTCAPTAPWPANQEIDWGVDGGQNPAGVALSGLTGGTFNTGSGNQLMLTNAAWNGGAFAFDVTSSAGQLLTVEYSSTMRSGQWQTLMTTNSPAGRVHIVDPHSITNRYIFYRARTGS